MTLLSAPQAPRVLRTVTCKAEPFLECGEEGPHPLVLVLNKLVEHTFGHADKAESHGCPIDEKCCRPFASDETPEAPPTGDVRPGREAQTRCRSHNNGVTTRWPISEMPLLVGGKSRGAERPKKSSHSKRTKKGQFCE